MPGKTVLAGKVNRRRDFPGIIVEIPVWEYSAS